MSTVSDAVFLDAAARAASAVTSARSRGALQRELGITIAILTRIYEHEPPDYDETTFWLAEAAQLRTCVAAIQRAAEICAAEGKRWVEKTQREPSRYYLRDEATGEMVEHVIPPVVEEP